jgi:MoaA/NifB/PqqE/SkfB family radical SAM enzyme
LHCDFWKLDDAQRAAYVSRSLRATMFAEFAALGGETIVTCGGEPMLDLELYYEIAEQARAHNLRMFSVINGTRVANYRHALRILRDGADEITVSLDDYIPEEHDKHRGVKGSFAVAERALKLMVEARRDLAGVEYIRKKKIIGMTIVREGLYRRLPEFFEYARVLGVDKLKLNILQPSFGVSASDGRPDAYYQNEGIADPEDLRRVLHECNERFSLKLNPAWIEQAVMYFRSMNKAGGWQTRLGWAGAVRTEYPICNSYDRNIMVDPFGVAKLCFANEFGQMKIAGPGDLTRFWKDVSIGWRERMVSCTRPCGISHSVRKEEATIKE